MSFIGFGFIGRRRDEAEEVTEEQTVYALKQMDSGTGVAKLCRTMGVSEATFYNWRKKYAGMVVTEVRELSMLREENRKLKQLPDDQTMRLRIWELSATRSRFGYRLIRVLLPPGRMDDES